MDESEKRIRAAFVERNIRGSKNSRVNENIWKLFKQFYEADKFETCYRIAEEINANRVAIMSLDGHICRLMERASKIEQKLLQIKNEDI